MSDELQKRRPLWGFREEFHLLEESGRLREEFFEKLISLVRKKIVRRNLRPDQLGYWGEKWDKEAINELAMDFFVWHLASSGNKRIQYLLDRAKDSDVDHLIIQMFDQFISELLRNRSPKRWNLRKRLKDSLDELVEQARLEKVKEGHDLYRPVGSSFHTPLQLGELVEQIPDFPLHKGMHSQGSLWASAIVGKKAFGEILEFVFTRAQGAVDVDTLTDFLCNRLGIRDAAFESIDEHGEDVSLLDELGDSTRDKDHLQGGMEARTGLRRAFEKFSPRQKKIFRMAYLQGASIPEICAAFGVKKSTVYDELEKIKKLHKEQLGS